VPYFVTCRKCGLLLYSAASISQRMCQRCGADMPEPQQGAPPVELSRHSDDDDGGIKARRRARAQ